ncbi:DoxX family protein [Streptomyces liangshanensis]|uniref:DoxX family protein n=1 Tax=Streptomyces liangshanensis TaxID=2717324 RepID=UPI0036D98238
MSSTLTSTRGAGGTLSATSPLDATDVGLLIIRVALGLTMASHGTQKLFGWFGGGGVTGTGQFFGASGYPAPKAFAVMAGSSEILGGLGLALGLLTPLAAAAVIGTIINAIAVKWGGGFFIPTGIEYELFIAFSAAGLALTGPGRIAVDHALPFTHDNRLRNGVVSVALGAAAAGLTLLVRN